MAGAGDVRADGAFVDSGGKGAEDVGVTSHEPGTAFNLVIEGARLALKNLSRGARTVAP